MNSRIVYRNVIASIMLIFVALAVAPPSAAVPPPPHSFWGTVKADGQDVPTGTSVTAWWFNDTSQWAQCGSVLSTVDGGGNAVYIISVLGDDTTTPGTEEGPSPGEQVRFKIAGEWANESSTWSTGVTTSNFDLTRTDPLPTPTPTSTATATNTPTNTPTATNTPDHPDPTATATLTTNQERIILQNGLEPQISGPGSQYALDIYEGTEDTYLDDWDRSTNFSTDGRLEIRTNYVIQPLIRFDLSPLPEGPLTVEYATLELYTADWGGDRPLLAGSYRMLVDWEASAATWYSATSSTDWAEAGCSGIGTDREGIASAYQNVDAVGFWYSWDVTKMVQAWSDDPESNHGLIIAAGPDVSVQFNFASAEYTTQGVRPKLSITFVRGTPVPTATHTSGPSPTPTVTSILTPTPSPTYLPGGAIAGLVWEDLDDDQVPDGGEPPLAGAEVVLRDGQGGEIGASITLPDGVYRFGGLTSGQYSVSVQLPPGFEPTSPDTAVLYLLGTETLTVDFGARLVHTVTPTAAPSPTPGFDITRAVSVDCSGTYQGNTTGSPAEIDQYRVSNSVWFESGSEDIYVITLSQVQDLQATLWGMTSDLDVFILPGTNPQAALAGGDEVALARRAAPGTYYIVVDGYEGAHGEYSLNIGCAPPSTPTPTPWGVTFRLLLPYVLK